MILFLSAVFSLVFFILPNEAFAWGPAMHLKLGMSIIENLRVLTGEVANIISNNTSQFLYGCVSADVIQAKRFLAYVLNCHNWANGFKLLRSAKSPPLKAFSLGYLSHLAADIIAHNCFIPAKMVETYSRRGLKHFLWEMRFDLAVFDDQTRVIIKEIIKMDHTAEDGLMNDLLKTVFFSFKTNKRIFSSLLLLQSFKKWQARMNEIYLRNNYSLSQEEIEYYFKLSLDAMISFLIDSKNSRFLNYDPTGKESLGRAMTTIKELRKKLKRGFITEGRDLSELQRDIDYFRSGVLK